MTKKIKGLLITTLVFVVLCVACHVYFGLSFIDVKLSEDNFAGLAFIVLLPLWFIVGGSLTVGSIILSGFLIKKLLKPGIILLAVTFIAAIFGVLALFVLGKVLPLASAFLL